MKYAKLAMILIGCALVASTAGAVTTTIVINPTQVPDETPPRVNVGDFPPGFDVDSWQGPATGKSNWHARYLLDGDSLSALFPADAATMTVNDIARISYWTNRPVGTPAARDWWIQVYTRPFVGGCASWYGNRFINNYDDHTATGAWTPYATDDATPMTFNKNGCGTGPELTLGGLQAGYGTELIEMFSVQTDSGWNGFDGYMDGLVIELTNGEVGRVNFEAAPQLPATGTRSLIVLLCGLAATLALVLAIRRRATV